MSLLLRCTGISKSFPGVQALSSVDFDVQAGEIHALVGENGAGKSTLMHLLAGVYQPDSGSIEFQGSTVQIPSERHAQQMGIGIVYQERSLFDLLTVAENIFAGNQPSGRLGTIDIAKMHSTARELLRRIELDVDPATPLGRLSPAQQQMVEIAKTLSLNARVIIMDEPTSSLTLSETERLLQTVKDLSKHGVSVIYISHRMGEIIECADRVVALRDGKNAGELAKEEITHDRMVALMVGRELKNLRIEGKGVQEANYFAVEGLRTGFKPKQTVSFSVGRGEILGFAGLVGAGRSEMAQAIFGVEPPLEGTIRIGGERVHIHNARTAISHGIYLVPEDRRLTGLITSVCIRENISLPALTRYSTALLVNRQAEKRIAQEQVEALRVKTPSIETIAANLSGGNQQKVVLGKWLSLKPKVMIFDEPTRGIDVGAKAEIYKLMRALADEGVAVIMISSDMEEVIGVSDRIAVMHEGRISGILSHPEFSEKSIMQLAVGGSVAAASN